VRTRTPFPWVAASACVRGRHHEGKGTPCQDAVHIARTKECVAVAVADGLGTCPKSHLGATAATGRIANYIARHSKCWSRRGVLPSQLLEIASAAIRGEAASRGEDVETFSCTLQVVAVTRRRLLVLHVGDGVVVAGGAQQTSVLCEPQRGEQAHQTWCIPDLAANAPITCFVRDLKPDEEFFALFTDGPMEAGLYSPRLRTVAPALGVIARWLVRHPIARVEEAIAANIEKVLRPNTWDDCTVAVLSRAMVRT